MLLGRFQQGIDDFNKALTLQPDFPDAVLALKTAKGDLQKAESKSWHLLNIISKLWLWNCFEQWDLLYTSDEKDGSFSIVKRYNNVIFDVIFINHVMYVKNQWKGINRLLKFSLLRIKVYALLKKVCEKLKLWMTLVEQLKKWKWK